jgi:hypothetical protein
MALIVGVTAIDSKNKNVYCYTSKNKEGVRVSGFKISPNEFHWLHFDAKGDRCENCTSSSWEFRTCDQEGECRHQLGEVQLVLKTDEVFQRANGPDMDILIKGGHERAKFRIDCEKRFLCEMCNPVWLRVSHFPCDGRAPYVQNIPLHVV